MALAPDDFPVLHELRAEGATDYVAFPLLFTDGSVDVASWSTLEARRIFAEQIADLEAGRRAADARRRNPRAAAHRDHAAQHLCRPHAGERILAGKSGAATPS